MQSSLAKHFFFGMGLALAFLCTCSIPDILAASVNLSWSANTESDLAGYKVYYGTTSRTYGTPINVGNVTTYTLGGLNGGTYFFAATAYDSSGNESAFSNEASVTIPGGTTPRCDCNTDGAINALDLQAEVNAILSGSSSSSFDINHDGMVNALDLQVLGNVVLGVTTCP